MRIKLVFLALFLLSFVQQNTFCQNPKAIKENAVWITSYSIGVPPNQTMKFFKTGGDTLISGKSYIKLYYAPIHQTGGYTYNLDGPFNYHYAFRNDTNKRAYIFPANDTIEHLWYDFNLSIGDALPTNPTWYSTSYLQSMPPDTVIVTNVDSILLCNSYFKRYEFNKMNFPDLVLGVGFIGDLIDYNYDYFEGFAGLGFFSPDTAMTDCAVYFTNIQNIEKGESLITINPNPTNDYLNIKSNTEIINFTIFNLEGRKVFSKNIIGKEETIDTRDLCEGIYSAVFQFADNTKATKKIVVIKNNR